MVRNKIVGGGKSGGGGGQKGVPKRPTPSASMKANQCAGMKG